MIPFNRFAKRPWKHEMFSAAQRSAADDDLRWLSLSRSNLRPGTTESEICHITLRHDETEDEVALPTIADDGRWA